MNWVGSCVCLGRAEDERQKTEGAYERDGRKISLSLISEMLTRTNSKEDLRWDRQAGRRRLQRQILRTQIVQVVLGLTLLVTCAVALIEERTLFGLGFAITAALASILVAVVGMGEFGARILTALNVLAFLTLVPSVLFMGLSLTRHYAADKSKSGYHGNRSYSNESHFPEDDEGEADLTSTATLLVLVGVQVLHLLPLGFTFLYNALLFRHLHHYTLL